jgi:hypothetical protein
MQNKLTIRTVKNGKDRKIVVEGITEWIDSNGRQATTATTKSGRIYHVTHRDYYGPIFERMFSNVKH